MRLTEAGHEVLLAAEPEPAAALLRERRPSLLILNILHPGFNTLAFLGAVRKEFDRKSLKVLVLSLTVWAERVAGPSPWVSDYLSKPVPLETLKASCEKALGGPLAGKNILVAEDDEILGMMLKHFLEGQKASVRIQLDGFAAVKAAQEGPADLLLLDIMLPGLNGFEILKILKDGPAASLPVIVVTAMKLNVFQEKGLLTGEPEIISRMVPMEFILEVTQKLLSRSTA